MQTKTRSKILKLILPITVILILLLLLVIPAFVSSQKGQKIILDKINRSIDGELSFTDLSMGWFRGIKLTDVSFHDNARQTSATVKQITTKPHYLSIFFGNLAFGKTIVDKPRIETSLVRNQNQKFQPHNNKIPTKNKKARPILLPIEKIDVTIKDGSLKVTDADTKTVELTNINSDIDLHRPGKKTSFDVNMALVDNDKASKVNVAGQVIPAKKTGWTLKGTTGDFTVEIDDLKLSSIRPFFALAGVELQAQGLLSADFQSQLKKGRIETLSGTIKGKSIDITAPQLKEDTLKTEILNIDVKLKTEKDFINIDKLDVKTDWADAQITGVIPTTFETLADFAGPDSAYNLKGEFDCDLAAISSQMPHTLDLKKTIEITSGRLAGNIETLTKNGKRAINGRVGLTDLAGTVGRKRITLSEPKADISFSFSAETDKKIINIDSLQADTSFGRIAAQKATLPISKRAKESLALPLSANIDMAKAQPFVIALLDFPQDLQLAGIVESQLIIGYKKDVYKIATDATKIKGLKITSPGQEPFEQQDVSVIFDVEANPTEKTLNVKELQLISPQIKIRKGQINQTTNGRKTKLQGRLEAEYDWAAVSTVAGPFLPKGLKLKGQRSDVISFSSEYPTGRTDKLISNLNTKGKLGFDTAEYLGLNFGPTEVDIQIQNGLLKIAPFSTTVNNGRLNFAANADFKQKPTLLRTPETIEIIEGVQINDETSKQLLMYINPIFADALNVSGTANFNCERLAIPLAQATQNDLEVIGTVSISDVHLQTSSLLGQILSTIDSGTQSRNITVHPTRFVLQNGTLSYDDMQIDVDDHPINFKGVIGLNKSLNMTVILPYTWQGRAAKIDRDTIEDRIPVPLAGTLDNPKLDLGKMLELQLQKRLEQELRKRLEKIF